MLQRVLIIKHGAFGDIILATGAIKAIRQHHPDSQITLLTTKPFVSLLRKCPWINEVVQDERSYKLSALLKLVKLFWSQRFDVVYDLQTSDRSSFYWWLAPFPKPKWSGIARFSSHRHNTPHRTASHTLDRLKEQLMIAGIISSTHRGEDGRGALDTQSSQSPHPQTHTVCPPPAGEGIMPDISWMQADISRFDIKKPYALLVPGGSPHRPEKRWPAERYAELAHVLLQQGVNSVLIGSEGERDVLEKIMRESSPLVGGQSLREPPTGPLHSLPPPRGGSESAQTTAHIINLCGQTSFEEIAELARGARLAIGNDTGPTHVIAATGCPTVALFATKASNPDLCAPKGGHITIIRAEDLFYLPVHDVAHAVKAYLRG